MNEPPRKGPQAAPAPQGEERVVEPLPPEERRKLFDLPEPSRAAAPAPSPASAGERPAGGDAPLELERDERAAAVEKAVTRIRAGGMSGVGCGAAMLRLAIVGLIAGGAMFAGFRFVFRG